MKCASPAETEDILSATCVRLGFKVESISLCSVATRQGGCQDKSTSKRCTIKFTGSPCWNFLSNGSTGLLRRCAEVVCPTTQAPHADVGS